ncbi:MAG: CDP-glycerol glycerophosphotransferase family protein [Clostridia bacterium]|nr:CDP-glycerol glycerophosphotransferase family protein [Clostridia bacterium]
MKKLIKHLLSLLPTKNLILFESAPDLSDNTKAVFDEMIRRGMNRQYKMVWFVSNVSDTLPPLHNVTYCTKGFCGRSLLWWYYRIFAKATVCCNRFLPTFRRGQTSFYLTHGTVLKSVRSYYTVDPMMDYMLVDGEATREKMAYELNYDLDKTVALGFPRNDVLTASACDAHAFFSGHEHDKIAVWYPTFRQHKNGMTATTKPLPLLHDEEQAEKLNGLARKAGVLLVLKPHFAQDISKIKARNLSHIQFIDDTFFAEHGITSYEFIGGCDAMITDYSSVYYDYLLCDKPIGLVWEDYEEYKHTVNFAVDMDHHMKAGEKIYTAEDFERFLHNLSAGNDALKDERAEICEWANYSRDGKNAQRVTDFIIEKAAL